MASRFSSIVIAGASQGLGSELAYRASQGNYSVALIARDGEKLVTLKNHLEKINPNSLVSIHPADLTNKEETEAALREISDQHKEINALVNCAATWTGGKAVKQLSIDDMQQSMMLNFFTAFNAVKALLALPETKLSNPLAIINVGATASLRGSKNCSAFAIAKGALRQFSQSLARELWPANIHVAHLIIDGLIANNRTRSLNPVLSDEKFIDMQAIADSILQVIQQEKSCWTFEWDLRPFNESW